MVMFFELFGHEHFRYIFEEGGGWGGGYIIFKGRLDDILFEFFY